MTTCPLAPQNTECMRYVSPNIAAQVTSPGLEFSRRERHRSQSSAPPRYAEVQSGGRFYLVLVSVHDLALPSQYPVSLLLNTTRSLTFNKLGMYLICEHFGSQGLWRSETSLPELADISPPFVSTEKSQGQPMARAGVCHWLRTGGRGLVPLAGKGCGKTVSQTEVTRHFHPSLVTCLAAKSTPAAYNGDPFLEHWTSWGWNWWNHGHTFLLYFHGNEWSRWCRHLFPVVGSQKSPCIYITVG